MYLNVIGLFTSNIQGTIPFLDKRCFLFVLTKPRLELDIYYLLIGKNWNAGATSSELFVQIVLYSGMYIYWPPYNKRY